MNRCLLRRITFERAWKDFSKGRPSTELGRRRLSTSKRRSVFLKRTLEATLRASGGAAVARSSIREKKKFSGESFRDADAPPFKSAQRAPAGISLNNGGGNLPKSPHLGECWRKEGLRNLRRGVARTETPWQSIRDGKKRGPLQRGRGSQEKRRICAERRRRPVEGKGGIRPDLKKKGGNPEGMRAPGGVQRKTTASARTGKKKNIGKKSRLMKGTVRGLHYSRMNHPFHVPHTQGGTGSRNMATPRRGKKRHQTQGAGL